MADAVLIFPTGRIDPDPALSPEAVHDLGKWSPSIEIILRHVPQTARLADSGQWSVIGALALEPNRALDG